MIVRSHTDNAVTISLDQFHWIGLANAIKFPNREPVYTQILEIATELSQAGQVRFPLSADRYHETLRTPATHRRIDVAHAMAALSRYETMVSLDTLTVAEIDTALASLIPGQSCPSPVEVFGHGALHAFGMSQLADSLRLQGSSINEISDEQLVFLTAQMQAVTRELMQNQFEWGVLSGDPRMSPLNAALRTNYDQAREQFAATETERNQRVHANGLDPRKAAYFFAMELHIDALIERCGVYQIDLARVPLEDPSFVERLPTVHVLAELLAGQYRNAQTVWKSGDWADMRTLCQAVVYCDVVAPDRHWAAVVERSDLPQRYSTKVLGTKEALLACLRGSG